MKWLSAAVLTSAAIFLTHSVLQAQEIIRTPVSGASMCEVAPASLRILAGGGCAESPCPSGKICVIETKKHTRNVYNVKTEEYCLPRCSLLGLFGGGCCHGDGQPCGDVRIRHRLVVKKVPDCDTKQCVLREAPPAVVVPGARCEPHPVMRRP